MADALSSLGSTGGAGISFSGVASGIDTQSIVEALASLERRPIDAAKAKLTKLTSQQSLVGTLTTKLKNLKDKAAALSTITQGLSLSATSSDTTKISASAGATATNGAHSITVTQLAKAGSSYLSSGSAITDPATALSNTGSIHVTYSGTTVDLDVTNLSLNAIKDAINEQVSGVNANVVNAGTSTSPDYRLVVTGDDTGASHGLSITADVGVTLTNTSISLAQNAIFSVDNLTGIQRETNTISDYLQDVTFTLYDKTETNKPVTLTIATDVSGVKNKIKGFVDAYNDVVSFYNTNNNYNSSTKVSGAFFGDSAVASIVNTLRQKGFNGGASYVATGTDNYGSLSAIGIRLQSDGTLQIDDSKLTERIGTSVKGVLDLFADSDGSGSDKGLAVDIRNFAQFASTGGKDDNGNDVVGTLDAKTASIKSQIATLQKTIDTGEDHVEKFTAQLKAKYAKFEQTMGQLKAQQAALLAKFGG